MPNNVNLLVEQLQSTQLALSNLFVAYMNARIDPQRTTAWLYGQKQLSQDDIKKIHCSESLSMIGFNSRLTQARVANIHNTLFELNAIFLEAQKSLLNIRNSSPDNEATSPEKILRNCLDSAQQALLESNAENNRLSSIFGKTHISFRENKRTGLSTLAAWWRKSFFQSRATRTLESARDKLDASFANMLTPSPKADPPPAYFSKK